MKLRNILLFGIAIISICTYLGCSTFSSVEGIDHSEEAVSSTLNEIIISSLESGAEVSLFVFMPLDSITNACPFESSLSLIEWKNSIRNAILSSAETIFLGAYSKYENFSIVERNRIEEILKEQKLSLSGLLDSDDLQVVGNLTGANYIVEFKFNRYCEGRYIDDYEYRRLIEIKTGKVLTSDEWYSQKEYSTFTGEYTISAQSLNRRPFVKDPRDNTHYFE